MDSKPLSDLGKKDLEIINLKLQILNLQYQPIMEQRTRLHAEECALQQLNPKEWVIDERQGALVPIPKMEPKPETK